MNDPYFAPGTTIVFNAPHTGESFRLAVESRYRRMVEAGNAALGLSPLTPAGMDSALALALLDGTIFEPARKEFEAWRAKAWLSFRSASESSL